MNEVDQNESAAWTVAARPVVNVFREASDAVEVTSQVIYGAAVTVLADAGAWWRIRMVDGYEGYALREGFVRWSPSQGARLVQIGQLSANVYRMPDVKTAAPVLNVPWEAQLAVIGEAETWLTVRLVDGAEAYVQRGDVRFDTVALSLNAMLAEARRFMGITYTWGGTSTYGFDCSGYVQMLFRQAGVGLPRDAQLQADWTGFEAVERDALEPADVIFFGENVHEIKHVGVYLGEGRFIHDTTEGRPGVQINELGEAHWRDRLIAQRRLRR